MAGASGGPGVVRWGAVVIAAAANVQTEYVLPFIAGALGAANVFGGFFVTDRMLRMFTRPKPPVPGTNASL